MKQKKTVNAIVHCIFGETPDEDKYKLQLAPPIDAHVCQQTGVEAIIRVARLEMRKEVQEDPSKPIPQIYEEVQKKHSNLHLEILARAKTILADGTFKITSLLWTQVFIISAQIDGYNSLFSIVKECLK